MSLLSYGHNSPMSPFQAGMQHSPPQYRDNLPPLGVLCRVGAFHPVHVYANFADDTGGIFSKVSHKFKDPYTSAERLRPSRASVTTTAAAACASLLSE